MIIPSRVVEFHKACIIFGYMKVVAKEGEANVINVWGVGRIPVGTTDRGITRDMTIELTSALLCRLNKAWRSHRRVRRHQIKIGMQPLISEKYLDAFDKAIDDLSGVGRDMYEELIDLVKRAVAFINNAEIQSSR